MVSLLRGLFVTLILCEWFLEASAYVSHQPRDTVAAINQWTYFNCSTTKPEIIWYHYPVGSDETQGGVLVYRNGKFLNIYTNDFEIDRFQSDGTYFYNLVIITVKVNFAGRYECRDDNGVGAVSSAQLIVIDSDPQCRSNSIPDGVIGRNDYGLASGELKLSCDVVFHGNVPPILIWTTGEPKSDSLNSSCELHDSRQMCNASFSAANYTDGAKFFCQTTQSVHHQHSCTSDLKVLYALNSTNIVDKSIDDEANCSLITNSHSCQYQWNRYDGENWTKVSNGSAYRFKSSGIYRCQALCELLDKKGLVFGDEVNVTQSTSKSEVPGEGLSRGTIPAIIVIVISSISLLIILMIICYFLGKRKLTAKNENGSPSEMRGLDSNRHQP